MKYDVSFSKKVQQFPGKGGWMYVPVPEQLTNDLKNKRRAWGMYPITARVGATSWKTKLMMLKGGGFFVALKASVRKKESIELGDTVKISFKLD